MAPKKRAAKKEMSREEKDEYFKQQRRKEQEKKKKQKAEDDGPTDHELLRRQEQHQINQKLQELRLTCTTIPTDGHCMYRAVSHQLGLLLSSAPSFEELRGLTADQVRSNKDDYLPFMIGYGNKCPTDGEFGAYCDKIANTAEWAGNIELQALAKALQCAITVVSGSAPNQIFGEEWLGKGKGDGEAAPTRGLELTLTYHKHLHTLGEHYNSCHPKGDHPSRSNARSVTPPAPRAPVSAAVSAEAE